MNRCANPPIVFFLEFRDRWLIAERCNYSMVTRLWMNHFGEMRREEKDTVDVWMCDRTDEQQIRWDNEFNLHRSVWINRMRTTDAHHWISRVEQWAWASIDETSMCSRPSNGGDGAMECRISCDGIATWEIDRIPLKFLKWLLFSLPSSAFVRHSTCPQIWNIDIIAAKIFYMH